MSGRERVEISVGTPIELERRCLDHPFNRGDELIERGNALHNMLSRIEKEGRIIIMKVTLNAGEEVVGERFQLISEDDRNKDRHSEIYSLEVIRDALMEIPMTKESKEQVEDGLVQIESGSAVVIPFKVI